jgi:hypothetical protein
MSAMDPVRLSRGALALLVSGLLIGGVVLGSAVTGLTAPDPSPTPAITPSPTASAAGLPAADVDGEDFPRLPRYPGSVRTEFELSRDEQFVLTAVEYFAEATLDEVRRYYQDVIEAHGWDAADITYAGGEWTYVLVDGSTEALVEIEITRGLVEIDLQMSVRVATPTPEATPDPTPAPTARPATPAPPPPPPDDDDDDDDDDREDDTDDGAGDTDD